MDVFFLFQLQKENMRSKKLQTESDQILKSIMEAAERREKYLLSLVEQVLNENARLRQEHTDIQKEILRREEQLEESSQRREEIFKNYMHRKEESLEKERKYIREQADRDREQAKEAERRHEQLFRDAMRKKEELVEKERRYMKTVDFLLENVTPDA